MVMYCPNVIPNGKSIMLAMILQLRCYLKREQFIPIYLNSSMQKEGYVEPSSYEEKQW